MTCRTCITDVLHCTSIADRVVSAGGEVSRCKGYKPYVRTITIGLSHAVFLAISMLFVVGMVGVFVGHELSWRMAEKAQALATENMLKTGLENRQSFYFPESKYKLQPRVDGKYNVSRGK